MRAARAESRVTEGEWDDFIRRAHRPLYARRVAAVVGTAAVIGIGSFAAGELASRDSITNRPVQPVAPTQSPEPSPRSEPDEDAAPRVPYSESELWFVQDERLSWGVTGMGGELSAHLDSDDPVARRAAYWLDILLGGPTGPDQEVGATTAIPEDTKLLGVSRDGSVLNVDLSSRFLSGGGSLSMDLRVAQIVYTGTQFEGIEAVRVLIEGERVDALGPGGVVTAAPLTRRDFQRVAPSIVLETPKPGEKISGSVTVAGFANVFEANVNVRIRDQSGGVLTETFTTATCGTGCWGDFSESVAFEVRERQEGRLEVFTQSAEDGSERDLLSIPVVLVP